MWSSVAAEKENFRPDRIIIMPKKTGHEVQLLEGQNRRFGRRKLRHFPQLGGLEVVQLSPGESVVKAITELRASGLVEFAEPDYKLKASIVPNDPEFTAGNLWGLKNTGQNGGTSGTDIHAVEGWDTARYASNVVVAVIDSGIRYTHEDLAENLWKNSDEIPDNGIDDDNNGVVDDIFGFNSIANDGDPFDENGHGTHVSGIIGAVGNNGKGVTGVAWKVQLMACKFLNGVGDGDTSDAIQCIDYARRNGAKVINASWGGPDYSAALYTAIQNARAAGIIFVTASGNNSNNIDLVPNYPASYELDNIVTVCAINRNNQLDTSYSSYGERNVDLAAPGSSIYSTWHTWDRAYTYLSGTSMAAPYISGIVALMRARYPMESAIQLKSRLLTAVDPVPSLAGKCVTGGRVNLAKALGPALAADFIPSVEVGEVPLKVAFTNTSFGEISSYLWDFGDGSDLNTQESPDHVFGEPGEYVVNLQAVGSDGRANAKSHKIKAVRNYEFVEANYGWIDPTGMELLALSDNGVSVSKPLGFNFNYYNDSFDSIFIGANGILGFFNDGLSNATNLKMPATDLPNAAIAPYWDNLNPAAGGKIYGGMVGEAPNRKYVVSWVDVPKNSNGSRMTFQVILEEGTNEMVFQYLEVHPEGNRGGGRAATVGLQEAHGMVGALYTHDGVPRLLSNNLAIRAQLKRYSHLGISGKLTPLLSVIGQPISDQELTVTLKNSGTEPISWRSSHEETWFTVSAESGVLEPGQSSEVVLRLDNSANIIPAGEYVGLLKFENLNNGSGNATIQVRLQVANPNPALSVFSPVPPVFMGGFGGPFSPESYSCIVSNAGNVAVTWKATSEANWLLISPGEGTVLPGQTINCALKLSPEVAQLPTGQHLAAFRFENLSAGSGGWDGTATLNVRGNLQAHTSAHLKDGTFTLRIKGDPGYEYVIEMSFDLTAWTSAITEKVGPSGYIEVSIPVNFHPQQYFRAREAQ